MTPQTRHILLLLSLSAQLSTAQTFFAPSQDYPIPNPSRPAFADFNGDGRTDMAVLSSVETIQGNIFNAEVYLYFYAGQNSSTSQFTQPNVASYTSQLLANFKASAPGDLYAGDFDGDQKQDILAFGDIRFYFLKGNGNGTFSSVSSTSATSEGIILIRDFNNDGKLDVMYGKSGRIRLGNGDGSFGNPTTIFSTACSDGNAAGLRRTLLADLNRDGLADAINECSGAGVAVSYRNPNGTFGTPASITNFGGRAVVNDFNSDGINDLLVITANQKVIRYGAPNGTLLAETSATVPVTFPNGDINIFSALGADLNFDGVVDLLVAVNDSFQVLVGTTPGLFSQSLSVRLGSYRGEIAPYVLEFVDINGDGGQDFYLWDQTADKISIYYTQPPSVFVSTSLNPATPGAPVTLTALIASASTGTVVTNQGQVTFYSGSNPIGAPVAVINGTANFTTSTLPQGIHYITAVFQATPASPLIISKLVTVIVTSSGCAASAASFTASGFRFDRNTNQFIQDIDITNRTAQSIPGPVSVMVAGLSPNATLATPYALSTCNSPGTPVVDAGICPNGVLAPNQTVRVTLRFNNPTRRPISYTPQTLAGLGRR